MTRITGELTREWLHQLSVDMHIALRNVLRQRRRSAFAILAVGFGIVAMLLAGGFIEWILWATREATIKGGLGHIQVVRAGFFEQGLADPLRFMLPERSKERQALEAATGVKSIAATLSFSGLASHGEATLSFLGEGVDAAAETAFSEVTIAEGRALSTDDPSGIVLGRGLAANLGVGVGDDVVLLATTSAGGVNAVEARIRGLFYTVSKAYDDAALRAPLSLAQQLLRTPKVHRWIIILNDTDRTTSIVQELQARLPGSDLAIVPWYQLADFYNKTLALLSRQVAVVNFIIAAIIVLGISNTLLMNVIERTAEIGTSMALGVSRSRVLKRFLAEGALLGLIGGVVGCALGVGLAVAISAKGIPMPPPPGMAHGYLGEILVSWRLVLLALALAVGTALIASIYPAWKASRLMIVDALRHNR